jgi:hypothetical protein
MALVSKTFSQIITFTRASTATFFNSAGTLTTAAVDAPRFDYNPSTLAAQGLLIEESRTNSIRNNTMQGAAAGTPGTLPTNWTDFTPLTGLTRQIVGTGTESGITYIDVRLSGTPSAAGRYYFFYDTSTAVAALNGQTWTTSGYFKLQAGTLTGVTAANVYFQENNSGGTYLTEQNIAITNPTSAALSTQRASATRTLNQATTAFLMSGFNVLLSGAAIDITLRIGLPQLEQGAFATSVIPTTTTALTRAADVASVNTLSPWYNASAGTIYADFAGRVSGTQPYITMLSNTGETERIYQRYVSGQYQSIARVAGVDIASVYNSSEGSAVNAKIATAYDSSQLATSTNGQAVTGLAVASLSSVPSGLNKLWLGSFTGSGSFANCYLRRVTYYPRALSAAELASITA